MTPTIFKPFTMMALLLMAGPGFAQDTTWHSDKHSGSLVKLNGLNVDIDMHQLHVAMNDLKIDLHEGLKDLNSNLRTLGPEIGGLVSNIGLRINDDRLDEMVQQGDINEKVKNYNKTYPMDANDRLNISNQFGKVMVSTWNKSEVQVDVQIKSYSDDDHTAQKMIDNIDISDNKSGDQVSFSTNFGHGSNGSIWDLFSGQNNHHRVEVNYTIHMPAKNALSIRNKYGSTEIPDMDGRVSVDCSYGSFVSGSLMGADNQINVRYGSVKLDNLASADVNVSYGSLDMGNVGSLNAGLHYSSARIGKIKNSASINGHYAGGIKIEGLDKDFKSFSYSSSYSNLVIGIDNGTNATFDVTVRYGGFDYGGVPIEITEKTPSDDSKGWKPTKNFKGHIGKGGATMNISTSYGGVKFE
ncbi:MAG: hypothetical protein ACXVB0_22585 [Mucilaginibacter sp.]